MVEKVNEYKQIQSDIQSDLQFKVRKTIIDVLMRSDRDENLIIHTGKNSREMKQLIIRLDALHPDVTYDADHLRKKFNKVKGDILLFIQHHLSSPSSSKEGKQQPPVFRYTSVDSFD